MSKKYRILIFICSFIFLAGVLASIWVMNRPVGTWVEIVQDGSVIRRLDLSQAKDQTIEIQYDGRSNFIEIENGKIRVSKADCPDHTCVNMGWLDSSVPIVCLPNHLVIQFAGRQADTDALVF